MRTWRALMPDNGPELCLCVWWFVLEGTDWVDQWAVRSYMLSGTDDQKSEVLQKLSRFDFVNVQWQPIPERYALVSPDGETARGATVLSHVRDDRSFFEGEVLGYLKRTFTQRNLITTGEGPPLRMEISRQPMQCDTVVVQTGDGRVVAIGEQLH